MLSRFAPDSFGRAGFTMMEVMVAALLIAMAIGSIMSLNAQAIHTLRASHLAAASSQVLQQRVEMIRTKPWPEVSSSTALQLVMNIATESEKELGDAQSVESIKVTVPVDSAEGPVEGGRSFSLRRNLGSVVVEAADDFSVEPTLIVEGSITWHDRSGVHRRNLRTLICRAGLTRSGIFGSGLGRATSSASAGGTLLVTP